VRARSLVPLALAAAYALWTFRPERGFLPGGEGDPLFNLWTFEHVWRQMDRLGPLHLWSDRFWSAPIFAGTPLQLAFSENQLYPALILRPLWRPLGGALALQWGAVWMTLAAFGCAFGWLRSLGLRELAGAGALLFACCGFVQSQYAHFQNLVAAVDPRWVAELSSNALLEPEGCFEELDLQVCLFRPRALPTPPTVRLDRDARWEYGATAEGWPLAQLRATRWGVLDYAALGRCRLAETTGLWGLRWTRELIFPGAHLRGARFHEGQVALARESRQAVFRLPAWARPTRTYAVRCG